MLSDPLRDFQFRSFTGLEDAVEDGTVEVSAWLLNTKFL